VKDVVALIVAAGAGRRFGGEIPKVFAELAGAPLLLWALRAYDSCPAFTRLVLAVSPAYVGRGEAIIRDAPLTKPVLPSLIPMRLRGPSSWRAPLVRA
jgi:2-C-methyl-D-erythritol 4-phosphate cytidylyltransferase/2-C-methyl-D-erythritol 2,4-cyclodiphosphate synthase